MNHHREMKKENERMKAETERLKSKVNTLLHDKEKVGADIVKLVRGLKRLQFWYDLKEEDEDMVNGLIKCVEGEEDDS